MIAVIWIIVIIILGIYFLSGLKVINEYERGVRFNFGRFSGIITPGLTVVLPIFQSWQKVDIRIKTIDVPSQECVSKDNVSIKVNAVLYFKVFDASKAIIEVENFIYAVSNLSQTTMRNIVGEFQLDEILQQREKISETIKTIVDKETHPWGVQITNIELKDIELAGDMKRVIAAEAEAEREKRAVIIKAEGEVTASMNLAKAAATLAKSDGALHLRTLQTINDISSDPSNKIIFTLPLELLRAWSAKK